MSVIAVTGATGQLGRLVVENMLTAGVPAGDVVAVVRTPERAARLAERGVQIREGDYDSPETLSAALAGADVVLLVSGTEVGARVAQHSAVVRAAENAGVGRIVYTSLLRADTSTLVLAPDHKETEAVLRGSAVPATILRNGWYTENYTGRLADHLARGVIVGAAGNGRIAAATRADYAAAAAAVLTTAGHEGAVYELGGTPFTMTELAAVISDVAGTQVAYQDVSPAELRAVLTGAGLDDGTAGFVAALDEATAAGALDTDSTDLVRLLGRPSTPLADAVRTALPAVEPGNPARA